MGRCGAWPARARPSQSNSHHSEGLPSPTHLKQWLASPKTHGYQRKCSLLQSNRLSAHPLCLHREGESHHHHANFVSQISARSPKSMISVGSIKPPRSKQLSSLTRGQQHLSQKIQMNELDEIQRKNERPPPPQISLSLVLGTVWFVLIDGGALRRSS
ncbi:MAG: hypothetical protein M2R45_04837 [Verrucomicrobia subdivision 3 bacterium]|nr:hypothetical protein [Limisphaerales bacterium]MCS1416648.1 hypothetical protein [Limisphaerales bacterium]